VQRQQQSIFVNHFVSKLIGLPCVHVHSRRIRETPDFNHRKDPALHLFCQLVKQRLSRSGACLVVKEFKHGLPSLPQNMGWGDSPPHALGCVCKIKSQALFQLLSLLFEHQHW
jgi:hypothetical protein